MEGEYDERLEEMMGLLRKTADGVDDLRVEVRDLRSGFRDLSSGLHENTSKLEHLTGRFDDVAGVVIKDTQRTTSLEQRVDAFESETH